MTDYPSALCSGGSRMPFGPKDRTMYPAFHLEAVNGSWRVSAVVSAQTPTGAWFDSGASYRLTDGRSVDGRDLYLDAKHAEAEAKHRNAKRGGWNGVRR